VLGCGAVAFVIGYLTPAPRDVPAEVEMVDQERYELPGYAGAPPRVLDPYAPPASLAEPTPKPALSDPAPQPALSDPASQPGLDDYLPGGRLAGGRHRGPAGRRPDVVQLPESDEDRSYRS
jgi:hypothetical protein